MMDRASYHQRLNKIGAIVGVVCFWILTSISPIAAQTPSPEDLKRERNRGVVMLQLVKDYLKEYYYDPTYHGMDVEARFKVSEEKIKEAVSVGQIMGIIAQTLTELNDSDAEAQGLKPGDEVLTLDGFKPTRQNIWKMEYNYNLLRPQPGKHVVVRTPEGKQRDLPLKAKVEKKPKLVNLTEYFNEINDEAEDEKKLPRYFDAGAALIWKLREFGLTESKVDDMMKKARDHKALILDPMRSFT